MTQQEKDALRQWTRRYPYPVMGLIEAMRQVQAWHLCIRPEDEEFLAELFEVPASHVHSVATFFPYFTQRPTGRRRIGLCRGLSCALAGSGRMADCLRRKLGVEAFHPTADGACSWEEMECLGACDQAPALLVNEELKGAATEALIDRLLQEKA